MQVETISSPDSQRVWQWGFYGLLVAYGSVILLTFSQYGITSDELTHAIYGEKLIQWYVSFFSDRSLFGLQNTWLYGGVFDSFVYLASQILPLDPFDARHLCNALVGFLGVVAAYRLGTLLGGFRAGFLAALFLVLTPRYYGHAFNNPKDIPFAVGYIWSLYYLIGGVCRLPNLSWTWIWKTGLAIGLTMGVRANGGVLMVYWVLFYGVRYIQLEGWARVSDWGRQLGLRAILTGGIAYTVMLVFWPWAQVHPLTGMWQGVRTFAQFPEVHFTFFEGRYVGSDVIPWYYVPKWLLLTLPEFVFVGWGVLLWGRGGMGDRSRLQRLLLGFGAIFPIGYAVGFGTPLYDGIRHLLFVVPPLVVLSAVGVNDGLRRLLSWSRHVFGVGLIGLLVWVVWDMVVLHPNAYVYFNRVFAGGVAQASVRYDTDYWNNSVKQGVRWIEAHFDRHPSGRAFSIGAFYQNLKYMVDEDRFTAEFIPEKADFYLSTTGFDQHTRVPGEVVHVIEAAGASLLYIFRPDDAYRDDPFFARSPYMHLRWGDLCHEAGEWEAAHAAYQKAIELVAEDRKGFPIEPGAIYARLGELHLKRGHYEQAFGYYERVMERDPTNGAVYNNIGTYFFEQEDTEKALKWIRKALEVDPNFFEAHLNLGSVYEAIGNREEALAALEAASRIRSGHMELQYALGLTYLRLGRYGQAVQAFDRVLKMDPGHAAALQNREQASSFLKDLNR